MTATLREGVMGEQAPKRKRPWQRRNTVRLTQFNRAIDGLQKHQYVTELWVDWKTKTITLRWSRKGSQWHVTVRGVNSMREALVGLANHALMWIAAVDSSKGNESNYAIREV